MRFWGVQTDQNDHAAVVVSIGIDEHGLGMRLGDHIFQVAEHLRWGEAVSGGGCGAKPCVRFNECDDFDFGAVLVLSEESVHVAVYQADDRNTQRRIRLWWQCVAHRDKGVQSE